MRVAIRSLVELESTESAKLRSEKAGLRNLVSGEDVCDRNGEPPMLLLLLLARETGEKSVNVEGESLLLELPALSAELGRVLNGRLLMLFASLSKMKPVYTPLS